MRRKCIGAFDLWVIVCLVIVLACQRSNYEVNRSPSLENEIVYQIFIRSFYDSDGDGHGDLEGLRQKLDYLQDLGVTTILMAPIYQSDFYHNYFATDFAEVDEEFGGRGAYFSLLEQVHRRGMKLVMDMEIHYLVEDHPWYRDSYENPASPYSDYILYNGSGNTKPEPAIYGLDALETYDGRKIKIGTANMYSEGVKKYHYDLFKFWVDPDGDGRFNDGVDGFRIDHICDDLDWKGIFTNMLTDFWRPLFHQLWQLNPDLRIIGEQAEWGYGVNYFEKGDLNVLYAFPLCQAIRTFKVSEIQAAIDSTYLATPEDKFQLIFIENHDMARIGTILESDLSKLKVCAALNILLKGIPLIYYGQEIGMTGSGGSGRFGVTDGNDIPMREAFEWYATVNGPGMALWYKDTGPWWDERNVKDNDGISLEEQQSDPNSLWNFYRKLIALRKSKSALQSGQFQLIESDDDNSICFVRRDARESVLVILNLTQHEKQINIDTATLPAALAKKCRNLLDPARIEHPQLSDRTLSVQLSPFDVQVWAGRK